MQLLVLDENLEALKPVDVFKSLIWTVRYSDLGDFELYMALDSELLKFLKHDYYLELQESDRHMIIEDMRIDSDIEDGSFLIITGRSLESILTRRIVMKQTNIKGSLQAGVQRLLNENFINPTDPGRKISNFVFKPSTDPIILGLTMDAQYVDDEVYTIISELCKVNHIGFKITLSADNKFVFELYSGVDRSYDQIIHPYVVFSPEFENLINSSYLESQMGYKNVILVGGEGEGADRKTVVVDTEKKTGLARRETFSSASGVSSRGENGDIPPAEYLSQLKTYGEVELVKYIVKKDFEGEVDYSQMFVQGQEFGIGDVVQLKNHYNIESKSRVSEIIFSQNDTGTSIYPTFTGLDKEGEI